MNYRMKYGILRGVTDTGAFIFTATVPDDLDTVGDTSWPSRALPNHVATLVAKELEK